MSGLRAVAAILLADLRQRIRTPRFWVVVLVLGAAMWWCFPPASADFLTVSVGEGIRGRYSSAWIGMTVALFYSSLLSLTGFYLVRGTVTRDLETRAWQLLVATTMSRRGYLLAKWLSHLVVFLAVLGGGLAVGLAAQYLRAEDLRLDLVELVKPALVLTLPSLALTAAFAVWFDLVPWLRRSAGNVLFFVLWMMLLSMGLSQQGAAAGTELAWPGDLTGLAIAEHDLSRALGKGAGKLGLSVGTQALEGRPPTLVDWNAWTVTAATLEQRGFWAVLSLALLLAATPFLDWFAARTGERKAAAASGARLRWLEMALAPLRRTPFGALVAAELRLVLRPRRTWWWLLLAWAFGAQAFAPEKGLAVAMLGGWLLALDVFARLVLREHATRTAALVFTAPGMRGRLLAARVLVAVGLAWALVLPALVRLAAVQPEAALATLAAGASVALWGLAAGAVCRSARPYELALLCAAYVSAQGALVLNVFAAPATTLSWHAALLPLAMGVLVVGWRTGVAARA